jgi:hypothetical protein
VPARVLHTLALVGCAALVLLCTTVASANVTPGVTPDIVLSPTNRTFTKHYNSLLVNDLTPQADASVVPTADQCRDLAPLDVLCDVYRIKIVRDTSKGAQNFVVINVDWPSQGRTPALALVAAGLSDSDLPDIDLFLYKDADTYLDSADVGGRGSIIPERIVWQATQDEYDLVVRAGTGVVTEYRITAQLSNEKFDRPNEVLDQPDRFTPPPDNSGAQPSPVALPTGDLAAPAVLPLAPIDSDPQISGIGLGTNEQFATDTLNLGSRTRTVAAQAEPPSTLVLIVAMLFFPAAAAFGAFSVLRRRRNAYTA